MRILNKMKFRNILPILILAMIYSAHATEITTLSVDHSNIDLKDKIYATAYFDGETCGVGINFLLDNKSFSSKILGCGREEISSGEWDLKSNPVDCGIHILSAELNKNNEILDTRSINIQIGNTPYLIVTPEKPTIGDDITLKLLDNNTGNPVSYTKITIYNIIDREGTKYEYTTDSSGVVKFDLKDVGEYRILLDDPVYCGSVSFYAKKKMAVVGPVPQNPTEGEAITMIAPRDVGIKVLDSSGNLYLRASTSFGGGTNFTISKAGNYTIVIGEISSNYWGKNVSLYVSGKPTLNLDIAPPIATFGNPVTITATYSDGSPVDDATVDILPPNGVAEPPRVTSSYGKVSYTPASVGKYEITVQKKGYSKITKEFFVSKQILILTEPEFPVEDEEFAVIVKDREGLVLSDTKVSIGSTSNLTDGNGKARFKLSSGRYDITAEKSGYNSDKKSIDVLGTLSVKLSQPQTEVGQNTEISVFDGKSNKISADIMVIKPDGTKESIGEAYTPQNAGDYEIFASKAFYKPVNTTLNVNPLPLNLTVNVYDGKLLFKVTSHENPVIGMVISLNMPSGMKDSITTDMKGESSWDIKEEGIITTILNPGNANKNYESKVLTQKIVRGGYNPLWLLLVFIPIVVVAVLYNKRSGKGSKTKYEKKGTSTLSRI